MTYQNVLDTFFLPEDQDGFARSQGYADAQQMCYYEDMTMQQEVPAMTDREVDELAEREYLMQVQNLPDAPPMKGAVEYLAPPPSEILVLMREDSREVYENDGDFSEWASAVFTDDLQGVY